MEFLGNLLCLLMDKTGRKAMHLSLMFLTGAACLSSAIPVLFGNECKNCILFRVFMCRKKNLKFISMKWHLLSIVLFFNNILTKKTKSKMYVNIMLHIISLRESNEMSYKLTIYFPC